MMKLTTDQVADKLKVSKSAVHRLRLDGILPSLTVPTNARRRQHRFDSRVVAEFAGHYKAGTVIAAGRRPSHPTIDGMSLQAYKRVRDQKNGHAAAAEPTAPRLPLQPAAPAVRPGPPMPILGDIITRLERIEATMTQLLSVWWPTDAGQ